MSIFCRPSYETDKTWDSACMHLNSGHVVFPLELMLPICTRSSISSYCYHHSESQRSRPAGFHREKCTFLFYRKRNNCSVQQGKKPSKRIRWAKEGNISTFKTDTTIVLIQVFFCSSSDVIPILNKPIPNWSKTVAVLTSSQPILKLFILKRLWIINPRYSRYCV